MRISARVNLELPHDPASSNDNRQMIDNVAGPTQVYRNSFVYKNKARQCSELNALTLNLYFKVGGNLFLIDFYIPF